MKTSILLSLSQLLLFVRIDLNTALVSKSTSILQRLKRYAPNPVLNNDQTDYQQYISILQNAQVPDPNLVNENILDYEYWNSYLGNNKSIKIEYGNEKEIVPYWMSGQPLKVITHGFLASEKNDRGVFSIKIAYVKTTNYNVITLDWSKIADIKLYQIPVSLTPLVGLLVAKLLENIVKLGLVDPSHIHLVGHSLGAQVFAATGATFNLGIIGRITGLDPAGPGYENVPSIHLETGDAQFVDIIHTAAGTLGYDQATGDVDFFPNDGKNPQPGCLETISPVSCSHLRSYELYTDSIYYRNSLIGVKCPSWIKFLSGLCKNNLKSPMGEDVDLKARGKYYLKTNPTSPYGIFSNKKHC